MSTEKRQTVLIVSLCVLWYLTSSTNNVIGKENCRVSLKICHFKTSFSIFRQMGTERASVSDDGDDDPITVNHSLFRAFLQPI
jgi:hypothetical protein